MPKNIIICCDGTANRFTQESKNTNVVKFFCLLDRSEPEHQVAYYDPGVGIISLRPFARLYDYFDRATGYGIDDNIKEAYMYLMNTFEEGDSIFLFGFSRGAYTVRSLSGMLTRCGLLEKRNVNLIDDAFYYYVKHGKNKKEQDDFSKTAEQFKNNFSRDVTICCIGVWDTVKALLAGTLRGNLFHDHYLSGNVRYGYQALAIDEHRSLFKPQLWEANPKSEARYQHVLQVWFVGVHADIGGGYDQSGLANITLEWMIAQVIKHGIRFKSEVPDKLPVPDPCAKKHDEYKKGIWWLLGSKQRKIPEGAMIHKAVEDRMTRCQSDHGYKPENLPTSYSLVDTPTIHVPAETHIRSE
jgi:uncharacterized protein (DUF2235 family)